MTIEFRRDRGLALTERCRDLHDFMALLRRGETDSLIRHLRQCPTCRAVAQSAIQGLVSEGIPLEPPAALRKAAEKLLAGRDAEEGPLIEILADQGGIRGASGVPNEIDPKRTQVRCDPPAAPFHVRMEVESLGGVFLLKISSRSPSDGVAILKGADDQPVAPSRRLDNPLAWPALKPGTYRLVLAGARGIVNIRLRLDYFTSPPRET